MEFQGGFVFHVQIFLLYLKNVKRSKQFYPTPIVTSMPGNCLNLLGTKKSLATALSWCMAKHGHVAFISFLFGFLRRLLSTHLQSRIFEKKKKRILEQIVTLFVN